MFGSEPKQQGKKGGHIAAIRRRLLHGDDRPQRVALGVAIGVFIAWSPMWGFHMIVALAISTVLGANKLAAVSCVWVHNPVTMGPMLYAAYEVGKAATARWIGKSMSVGQVEELFHKFTFGHSFLSNFHKWEFWSTVFKDMLDIGAELWVGCTILGIISAAAAYAASYYLIVWHRQKRAGGI